MRTIPRFVFFAASSYALVVTAAAQNSASLPSGDQRISVVVSGRTRTGLLHTPPDALGGGKRPVVIAFHGSRGDGHGMAAMTGFSALADRAGFLAVYPDGLVEPKSWNSLFGTVPGGEGVLGDDIDDVAFVGKLIDVLIERFQADPRRIFVCGHSSGAYLAYRLALELPGRIAAAGIVNGSIGIKSVDGKPVAAVIPAPAAPVSLIHICGKQDTAVKFGGFQTPKNLFRPVPECVRIFVGSDGCDPTGIESTDREHRVVRTRYAGGKGGTEVELVVVENCGHAWPTDKNGLSATHTLWDFFAAHAKAIGSGAKAR